MRLVLKFTKLFAVVAVVGITPWIVGCGNADDVAAPDTTSESMEHEADDPMHSSAEHSATGEDAPAEDAPADDAPAEEAGSTVGGGGTDVP